MRKYLLLLLFLFPLICFAQAITQQVKSPASGSSAGNSFFQWYSGNYTGYLGVPFGTNAVTNRATDMNGLIYVQLADSTLQFRYNGTWIPIGSGGGATSAIYFSTQFAGLGTIVSPIIPNADSILLANQITKQNVYSYFRKVRTDTAFFGQTSPSLITGGLQAGVLSLPTATSGTKGGLGVQLLAQPTGNTSIGYNSIISSVETDTLEGRNFTNYMNAFTGAVKHRGTGIVTNASDFVAQSPYISSGGTIANQSGIVIQPQKITGVTNGYSILQLGTTDKNIFNGPIHAFNVPVDSSPDTVLTLVNGKISRAAYIGGTSGNAIISGLAMSLFINGSGDTSIVVSPGTWRINNTIYSKATSSFFPILPRPIAGEFFYETAYATTSNTISIIAGTSSPTPIEPAIPANTVRVGSALVSNTGIVITPTTQSTIYNNNDSLTSNRTVFFSNHYLQMGDTLNNKALFIIQPIGNSIAMLDYNLTSAENGQIGISQNASSIVYQDTLGNNSQAITTTSFSSIASQSLGQEFSLSLNGGVSVSHDAIFADSYNFRGIEYDHATHYTPNDYTLLSKYMADSLYSGGVNIYNSDGTLTGARTVSGGGNTLQFSLPIEDFSGTETSSLNLNGTSTSLIASYGTGDTYNLSSTISGTNTSLVINRINSANVTGFEINNTGTGIIVKDEIGAIGLVANTSIDTANMTSNPKAYVTSEWVAGRSVGAFLPLTFPTDQHIDGAHHSLVFETFTSDNVNEGVLAIDSSGFYLGAYTSGNQVIRTGHYTATGSGLDVVNDLGTGFKYSNAADYATIGTTDTLGMAPVGWVQRYVAAHAGTGTVTSVSGTTNRITSTGGATPVIDISSTFEALLGKVANPLSQFASTTSAQLAGVLSDESGTGVVAYTTNPVFTTPNLGTPSAVTLTNGMGLPATGLTGTLQVAQFPALTGDVTTSAGSLATAIGAGKVTNTMLAGSISASKLVGTDITTVGTLAAGSIPYSLLTGTPTIPTGANPTASAGLSAVNGLAATFMRSDGAPAIDQSISPTWTGFHTWSKSNIGTGVGTALANVLGLWKNPTAALVGAVQNSPFSGWEAQDWNTSAGGSSQAVDILVRAEAVQGTNASADLAFYLAVNGGNPAATGVKIGGTGRITAPAYTISNAPSTSASTYDILTRNTSTGVQEKITSATLLPAASVSSAGTLTLAHGIDYVFTGTTATYTLPAISATTTGRAYQITIKNRGSGLLTVNSAAGGNDIYTTSAVSTFTISAGSSATLMPDGTYFNLE